MHNLIVLIDKHFQFFQKNWLNFFYHCHSSQFFCATRFSTTVFCKSFFNFETFFSSNGTIVNKYLQFIGNQSCSSAELPTAVQLSGTNATYFCFSKLLRSTKNFVFSSWHSIQGSFPLKPKKNIICIWSSIITIFKTTLVFFNPHYLFRLWSPSKKFFVLPSCDSTFTIETLITKIARNPFTCYQPS